MGEVHGLPVLFGRHFFNALTSLVGIAEFFNGDLIRFNLCCLFDNRVVGDGAARASGRAVGRRALLPADDLVLEELGQVTELVARLLLAGGEEGVGVFGPSAGGFAVKSLGSKFSLLSRVG